MPVKKFNISLVSGGHTLREIDVRPVKVIPSKSSIGLRDRVPARFDEEVYAICEDDTEFEIVVERAGDLPKNNLSHRIRVHVDGKSVLEGYVVMSSKDRKFVISGRFTSSKFFPFMFKQIDSTEEDVPTLSTFSLGVVVKIFEGKTRISREKNETSDEESSDEDESNGPTQFSQDKVSQGHHTHSVGYGDAQDLKDIDKRQPRFFNGTFEDYYPGKPIMTKKFVYKSEEMLKAQRIIRTPHPPPAPVNPIAAPARRLPSAAAVFARLIAQRNASAGPSGSRRTPPHSPAPAPASSPSVIELSGDESDTEEEKAKKIKLVRIRRQMAQLEKEMAALEPQSDAPKIKDEFKTEKDVADQNGNAASASSTPAKGGKSKRAASPAGLGGDTVSKKVKAEKE